MKIFFCHSFVYGQRCFVPKNHKNWPYHFGDTATISSKTWFFTIFTFSAFLTHPNDQKMFRRARSQFFHVLKHQKFFLSKLGPPWSKSVRPCLNTVHSIFLTKRKKVILLRLLLNNPIFLLFPKFLEFFFTPKNTPPNVKNSKPNKRDIFLGHPVAICMKCNK